jgi:hypothetical protein
MARRRSGQPSSQSNNGELATALEAMGAPQLRACVRAILDELDDERSRVCGRRRMIGRAITNAGCERLFFAWRVSMASNGWRERRSVHRRVSRGARRWSIEVIKRQLLPHTALWQLWLAGRIGEAGCSMAVCRLRNN